MNFGRALPYVAKLAIISVAWAFVFAAVLTPSKLNSLFNSDLLHPQALLDDVFERGGSISDWTLPPNPSLFPDGLMFLSAWSISQNFRWSFLWYVALSVFIILLVLGPLVQGGSSAGPRSVSEKSRTGKDGAPSIALLLLIAGTLLFPLLWELSPLNASSFLYMSVLVLPISHGSVFVLAILAWILVRKALPREGLKTELILAGILTAATASDRLVQVVVGMPLLLVLLVEWRSGNTRALRVGLVVVSSLFAGEALLRIINEMIPSGIVPPAIGSSWTERVWLSAQALGRDIFRAPHIAFITLGLFGWIVHKMPQLRTLSNQEMFLMLAFLASLTAPVLTGVYRSGAMRYVTPGIALGMLCVLLANIDTLKVFRSTLLVGTVGVLSVAVMAGAQGAYFWYRPQLVRCLDGSISTLGSREGVADFWNASRVSYLSTERLSLVPLDNRGRIFDFAVNRRRAKMQLERVTFAVMDRLNPKAIRRKFGPPESILDCSGAKVWIFSES